MESSTNTSTFSNNIFTYTPAVSTNIYTGNFNNVIVPSVFVNQSGTTFSFSDDYHLVSPATYQGNNGSQVGIYGGLHVWKEGTLPENPHIRLKSVATQTAPNGDLNIQFEVAAQDE